MNRKQTLKDAFEKLCRESIHREELRSKDFFFNKTKLVLAKKKMCAPSKENGSILTAAGKNKSPKADKSRKTTWKTAVHKRQKPCAPKHVRTLKQQKENLRDIIDKLYLNTIFSEKKVNQKISETKRRKNHCLLTRNVKNIERRKLLRNQVTCETEKESNTLIDSKVTVCATHLSVCRPCQLNKRSSANSAQEYSSVKSMNDSGVFLEDKSSTTDDDAFETNTMNKSLRKRALLKDENESSHIKKLKSVPQSMENPKKNKNISPTNSITSKFGCTLHPVVVKPKLKPLQLPTSTAKRKPDFQPLFSSHCGGTWKAIVEEN